MPVCSYFWWLGVGGLVFLLSGCGSMYSYYSRADAATLKTNGWITAMDADRRTREAGVFYIKPGSRIIGVKSKSAASPERLLLLEVAPGGSYRVDFTADTQTNEPVIQSTGKTPAPEYRWCEVALACKANEPFDRCVRRLCS